jgi:UDP-glucose 4-epimerase
LCRERRLARAEWFSGTRPIVEIGDITDEARVKQVVQEHQPEVVIHLAALTGVKRCEDAPSLAFSVNVEGTYNLTMACVERGCRLIFSSSREVYGETKSGRTREEEPLIPNNIYGLTKMLGERIVTWASSKYDLDYTILRMTNVYGPGGDNYNIQAMIRKALTEGRIQILGGSQIMNLVYVEDVAKIVARCLTDSQTSRQTFNVGSSDDLCVEDIVSEVVSLLDFPVKIERRPMRPGETFNFRPSLEKLQNTLGYNCPTGFTTGLRKTVGWYKEHLGDTV